MPLLVESEAGRGWKWVELSFLEGKKFLIVISVVARAENDVCLVSLALVLIIGGGWKGEGRCGRVKSFYVAGRDPNFERSWQKIRYRYCIRRDRLVLKFGSVSNFGFTRDAYICEKNKT
jgi:hypothetical protein